MTGFYDDLDHARDRREFERQEDAWAVEETEQDRHERDRYPEYEPSVPGLPQVGR